VVECLDQDTGERIEEKYVIAIRAAMDTIIVLFIICSNALIVLAIARHRRHGKKLEHSALSSASVRFALNLAVSDLLVGVSTTYYLSSKYLCSLVIALSHLKYLCLFMFVMIVCAHAASAYTIVAIAIDRYIAVVHALRYRELMSTRTSRVMVAVVWIFSICISTPIMYWNKWSSSKTCDEGLVVPLQYLPIVSILSHIIIMGIVGGFHRRIHHEALASDERKRSRASRATALTFQESKMGHKFRSKSAKVLLLVTGCYIICWTPITVIFFIRGYAVANPLIDVLYNYFFTFLNINYVFNPIVYSWMNPTIRTAIVELFYVFTCKKKALRDIANQSAFPSVSTVYSVT
ncbi:hypothetical protein L9F63_002647, partial [Diploptera punctata]